MWGRCVMTKFVDWGLDEEDLLFAEDDEETGDVLLVEPLRKGETLCESCHIVRPCWC